MQTSWAPERIGRVILKAELRAKAWPGLGRLGLSRGKRSHDRGVFLAACRGSALSCGGCQAHQAGVDQLRELPQRVEAPPLGDDRPHRPLTVHRQERLECAAVERHGLVSTGQRLLGDQRRYSVHRWEPGAGLRAMQLELVQVRLEHLLAHLNRRLALRPPGGVELERARRQRLHQRVESGQPRV